MALVGSCCGGSGQDGFPEYSSGKLVWGARPGPNANFRVKGSISEHDCDTNIANLEVGQTVGRKSRVKILLFNFQLRI